MLMQRLSLAWFAVVVCIPFAVAQEPAPSKDPQQAPPMGVSTGVAHAPVKDAQSRPITAGGFVDGAPVVFADITKSSGLDKFRHHSGTAEKKSIIETPGSGVALLDYDNDGWLDIYFCLYLYYQGTDQYKYPLPYFDANNGPPNALMRAELDHSHFET